MYFCLGTSISIWIRFSEAQQNRTWQQVNSRAHPSGRKKTRTYNTLVETNEPKHNWILWNLYFRNKVKIHGLSLAASYNSRAHTGTQKTQHWRHARSITARRAQYGNVTFDVPSCLGETCIDGKETTNACVERRKWEPVKRAMDRPHGQKPAHKRQLSHMWAGRTVIQRDKLKLHDFCWAHEALPGCDSQRHERLDIVVRFTREHNRAGPGTIL